MSNTITIHFATEQELPMIVSIYNSTIASKQVTADLEPVSIADRTAWFHEHDTQKFPLWVAKDHNNHVVGWLSFSRYYSRAAYDISAEVSIYIHPEIRHAGLGQQLLNHALTWAKTSQLQNIIAIIFSHNQPSCRFFEKNQFKQWGYLPKVCQLHNQLADVVIFGLALEPMINSQA